MISLALAAASGLYTAPVPVHEDTWISPVLDFPVRGIPAEVLNVVRVEITVNPYGGMSDCRARVTAGNPNMADYTCHILKNRTRFKPARDPSGKRMYGVYRQTIKWWKMDTSPPPKTDGPAEFQVETDRIPPGIEGPAATAIQFAVDTAGNGSACRADEGVTETRLAQIACERLAGALRVEPARDRRGRPVPSVQTARVKFLTTGASK